MINQQKKQALVEQIKQLEVPDDCELLLAPELYFDGYDEAQCTICANNPRPVSTAEFHQRLREIQSRPDVSGVFIRLYNFTDAEASEDSWIGSDSVYVITSATPGEVQEWFADLEVADAWTDNQYSKFVNLPEIPDGHQLVAAWWD